MATAVPIDLAGNGDDGTAPPAVASRRHVLALAAAGAAGLLSACQDRSSGLPAWAARHVPDWALGLLPTPPTVPPLVPADLVEAALKQRPLPPRYRTAQRYLLQGVPTRELASRVTGGRPLLWDQFGPTYTHVDAHTGWPWSRPGGDWLDATGIRHGPNPWFSVPMTEPLGPDGLSHYFVDVSRLVQQVQARNRWLALLLMARNTARSIGGSVAASRGAPAIDVVYSDGTRERLRCRVAGQISPSSQLPATALAEVKLPACLEFERPHSTVASARLRFVVTDHWSGQQPSIDGFLLDPPVNAEPVRLGLAQLAAPLDAGLESQPEVIGVHRYLDGRPQADFVHPGVRQFSSEHLFDPAIYGTGAEDRGRLPHAGLGKWINAGPAMALVPSTYLGDGFAPLAPGLGALRLQMPATPGVRDGSVVGNDGTLGGHARIFLPEHLFGRLDRLFVRYYVRLGVAGPGQRLPRLQVRHIPGQDAWTNLSGKFGIGPDHTTSQGGVSGTSGGPAGWQMRLAWYECDADQDGPDERGWAPGFHLYDFQGNNPVGHRYGRDRPAQFERWGQRGGTGGLLYVGHWYCIETELKLNTVTSTGQGYLPDGELRAWVDGRQVYEQTGMVFRSLPPQGLPYNPSRLRPCRELGVCSLWLNWFHGGQTVNTMDRTLFYTGLAWAKKYIGPMAF